MYGHSAAIAATLSAWVAETRAELEAEPTATAEVQS